MKRLMLIAALMCASLFGTVSAKSHKTISSVDSTATALELSQDSTLASQEIVIDTCEVYLYQGRLYDVDRIQIINPGKDSVLIMNDQGVIVVKTTEDGCFEVPAGNYWIVSNKLVVTKTKFLN